MSKAAYWQRGEAIDYTNGTVEKIEANTIVDFGGRIGVAGTDIEPGETGTLHVEGVFEMPKKDQEEIALGAAVCFKDGKIQNHADGNVLAGYATQAAAAAETTVKVKLLG